MQTCHDSTNVKGRMTRRDKTHKLDKDAPDSIYFKLWRFSLVGKVVENRILLHELWPRERKKLSVSVFFGRDTGCCCCYGWELRVVGLDFGASPNPNLHLFCLLAIFSSSVTGWKSHFADCCYLCILNSFFLDVFQIKIYDVCYFLSCLMLHY